MTDAISKDTRACQACDGTGIFNDVPPGTCVKCDGTGRVAVTSNTRFSLWSFLRGVLERGEAIMHDYEHRGYEEKSARIDEAARELEEQLRQHLNCQTFVTESETNEIHHRDPSRPSAGQKVIRDVASESVHVPGADPTRDGSGHPAGSQSGVPPREANAGGVTSNAGAPGRGVREPCDRAALAAARAVNCGWISASVSGLMHLQETIRIALDTEVQAGGPYVLISDMETSGD